MLKIVFNGQVSFLLQATNFNQSTTFNVDGYSNHSTRINLNIDASSISNLSRFENTPITAIRVLTEDNVEILRLSFNENNMYILNYNTSIHIGGQSTNVVLGQIEIPEQEPEPEPEEPESGEEE